MLRKTGFIAEDKYLLTVGCGLEVIRKHLEKEVQEYKEQETTFRMKNIKNSSRLVHQLERIRMGGRDLTEDLSEQSRRKLMTELMNSKHDANNLLLDMKKEIELFICKDIDAEEKNDLEIVIEDLIFLKVICTIFDIGAQNDFNIFQTLTVLLFFHLSQK